MGTEAFKVKKIMQKDYVVYSIHKLYSVSLIANDSFVEDFSMVMVILYAFWILKAPTA